MLKHFSNKTSLLCNNNKGKSLIRVFGNVMVTLITGSQILNAFCAVFGICTRKKFIQRIFR